MTEHGFHPLSVFTEGNPMVRLSRHEFRYHRLSTRARLVRIEEERPLPLPIPRQPGELPLPEPNRFRFEPINLNTVPSAMEERAASWRR